MTKNQTLASQTAEASPYPSLNYFAVFAAISAFFHEDLHPNNWQRGRPQEAHRPETFAVSRGSKFDRLTRDVMELIAGERTLVTGNGLIHVSR